MTPLQWHFSLRAGKRDAAIMSFIHSARLNGRDPYAYLRDVMERLPTRPAGSLGYCHTSGLPSARTARGSS